VWQRQRALALLVEAWPELGSDAPPSLEALGQMLAHTNWRLLPSVQGRPGQVRSRKAPPSYEASVMAGEIPTRPGSWHDVFNVIAFARFPIAKAALHRRAGELQAARRALAQAQGSRANDRGREEDALALIDECSLVLAGTPEAIAQFEAIQTGSLDVIDHVIRSTGIRVRVLGHALHEHLVLERPPISTTLVTIVLEGPREWARVDAALAERIAAGGFPRPQREARLPWPDPVVDAWLE